MFKVPLGPLLEFAPIKGWVKLSAKSRWWIKVIGGCTSDEWKEEMNSLTVHQFTGSCMEKEGEISKVSVSDGQPFGIMFEVLGR